MVNLDSEGVCLCLNMAGQIKNKENSTPHLTYPYKMNAFLVTSTIVSTNGEQGIWVQYFFTFGWSIKLADELLAVELVFGEVN